MKLGHDFLTDSKKSLFSRNALWWWSVFHLLEDLDYRGSNHLIDVCDNCTTFYSIVNILCILVQSRRAARMYYMYICIFEVFFADLNTTVQKLCETEKKTNVSCIS